MIIKQRMAQLPMCYSITLMNYQGREYCISASEERDGKVLMIDTETREISEITGLAGGVMAIVPIPEEEGGFLAIQKFYPVFDSEKAEVVHAKISGPISPVMAAEVNLTAAIPFVHRIALVGKPGGRLFFASTLCGGKAFTDDWSQPGFVDVYALDENFVGRKNGRIKEGLYKNHGMYTYEKRGGAYTMVSAAQGVFAIDRFGRVSKLFPGEVSDFCLFDVDRDGRDEIIAITPFHGDHLNVYKSVPGGWMTVADEEMNFGHAVWSGMCNSTPIILACSRGGDKATVLYKPLWKNGELEMPGIVVDDGVGASNIAIKEDKGIIILYAANHGTGEVAKYTIDLSL